MKLSRPFVRLGELILVDAKLRGPRGEGEYQLVLDTGAAATTLLPEIVEELGYSARDGIRPKTIHSALSEEEGYTLKVAELSVLGVTTPDFEVHVSASCIAPGEPSPPIGWCRQTGRRSMPQASSPITTALV